MFVWGQACTTCILDPSRQIVILEIPSNMKIFVWLFFKDRLNTKANLLHKNIMENGICHRCSHPGEDMHHVFSAVKPAAMSGSALGSL